MTTLAFGLASQAHAKNMVLGLFFKMDQSALESIM